MPRKVPTAAPKRINSRQKGAGGEREFANLLKSFNIEAKRGQQHAGGVDSPDVIVDGLTKVHFEVKRVEAGNPYDWYEQAVRDGVGKLQIVAHRRNGKPWLAILNMDDMIDLLLTREGMLL